MKSRRGIEVGVEVQEGVESRYKDESSPGEPSNKYSAGAGTTGPDE